MEIHEISINELSELYRKKAVSPREVVLNLLNRIEKLNKTLNAFITVDKEYALKQADHAMEMLKDKDASLLCGVPVAVKDIFATRGMRTTCASKILENFIPPYDATVISKLKKHGAVFIGKTNMDEFAMGSSTETSYFGPAKNPYALDAVPGGSSGGSASAVSADMAYAALGTDTGGSIRQPASLCGIVGLKPTYGRVSRYGMIAFASSLDQGGTMTKTVYDTAAMLEAIAGFDPLDSTSADVPVEPFTSLLTKDIRGMKIGVPEEYFIDGMDKDVEQAVHNAIDVMKGLGSQIVDISLPHTKYAVAVYYILASSEASSNLARYDGVRFGYRTDRDVNLLNMYKQTRAQGFGKEVKRRIMLGTFALSAGYYEAFYGKAQRARRLIKNDFDNAFKQCDVILAPTSPTPAFKFGSKLEDPLKMYLSDIFTIPLNLAGLPGIAIPAGFSKEKLPIGIQLIGRMFDEKSIFNTAYAYENAVQWHKQKPSLKAG
ncbi:MAG: Asp-tRNA(Asn)/Glu-tRNA(Gln) amidotransferase subunit GatA [Deltaproteobacteria bacterium]|nr:Asp-tRNA(Asn)/Glu-tRNA(Gln) amidotransferase subunit GatA [Deltaproteobacteria bacterium]MCL5791562.1 Asp-tRNA(Asn)/Glu-tRNA(Gln) amidotransferase subunit GatA [Deltaproteobacteria bacterium]